MLKHSAKKGMHPANKRLERVLGQAAVRDLDPRKMQFLTAVELPTELNPGAAYGLKAMALLAYLQLPHIKCVPAFWVLFRDFLYGVYDGIHTLVVPSSGNFVHGIALLARAFGFTKVIAVVRAGTSARKRRRLASIPIAEIVEAGVGESTMTLAKRLAAAPGRLLLNQYTHWANMAAHALFTGREVLRACGGCVDAVVIALGSGATAGGAGQFMRKASPDTLVIAVRVREGSHVEGARTEKEMESVVTLPWKSYVHCVVEGGSEETSEIMDELKDAFHPRPGHTSALALVGLRLWFNGLSEEEKRTWRGKRIAVIFPDSDEG